MKSIVQLIILVFTLQFSSKLFAQDTIRVINKSHSSSVKIQYLQIKEEFNYGLLFSGPNLVISHSFTRLNGKNMFTYHPELGFGFIFNKGTSMALRIKPIDIFYGRKIYNNKTNPLTLGAYFATNYQWQLYPELQSGHMFWVTSIEVGPQLEFTLPLKSKLFKIIFSNSLAGLTSRPEPSTETYFYSLKLSDFIRNAHSNLSFGSYNTFNHSHFEIELINTKSKRHSFAYEFDYFGYYQNPSLSILFHSVNLNWKIGKL